LAEGFSGPPRPGYGVDRMKFMPTSINAFGMSQKPVAEDGMPAPHLHNPVLAARKIPRPITGINFILSTMVTRKYGCRKEKSGRNSSATNGGMIDVRLDVSTGTRCKLQQQ
jgi:hypothetical protein